MYKLNDFHNGKAYITSEKGQTICINTNGEKLFELPLGVKCHSFLECGLILVRNQKNKFTLMNEEGKFLTDFIYDWHILINSNPNIVKKGIKYGYLDLNTGKEILPCIYLNDYISFNEGIACVHKDFKYGGVNCNNETVIPFEYAFLSYAGNELFKADKFDDEEGYIDNKGNEIIQFGKFKNCSNFNSGLAKVTVISTQEEVYINPKGEILQIKV